MSAQSSSKIYSPNQAELVFFSLIGSDVARLNPKVLIFPKQEYFFLIRILLLGLNANPLLLIKKPHIQIQSDPCLQKNE